MPKFEKRFRKEILKPISTLSDQTDQEEILMEIRRKIYDLYCSLFWEAKDFLLEADIGSKGKDIICQASFTIPGVEAEREVEGLQNQNVEVDNQGVQNGSHSRMQDGVSRVLRERLLPQVIKSLLILGGKDGREFDFISVRTEDLVVCLLLDFVGFIGEVMQLGAVAVCGGKEADASEGRNANVDDISDADIDVDNNSQKEGEISKKRSRNDMEHTQNQDQEKEKEGDEDDSSRVPNMLTFLGDNLLDTLSRVLAAEACHTGYLEFVRMLRSDEWHGPISEREEIQRNLPYYYRGTTDEIGTKAHSAVYDVNLTNDSLDKDDYLTPLRTGEWAEYYCLYYPSDANGRVASESKGDSRLGTFGRHLIAITRYFVQGCGLENLNRLLEAGLRLKNGGIVQFVTERINAYSFKSVMEIFHSISYLASYVFGEIDSSDQLGLPFVYNDLEIFRQVTCNYLDSIEVGVDDARTIFRILAMMDDRSLTKEERRNNASEQHVLGTIADLTREQSDAIKLSTLWRFITGQSSYGEAKDSEVTLPSLQCQVLSLTELRSWLIHMENLIGMFESDYLTSISLPALDVLKGAAFQISQNYGVTAAMPTLDLLSMKSNQNCRAKADEGETSSMPALTDGFIDVNDGDEQGSTEVCCHSNASLSSNDDVTGQLDESNDGTKDEPVRATQGSSSYVDSISSTPNDWGSGPYHGTTSIQGVTVKRVILQSKERLFHVLDAMKSPKSNFLEKLLTTNLHRELLNRILPLLELFTRYGRLNNSDIELLWNLSGMKEASGDRQHISVTSAIIDLLVGLLNSDNWLPSSFQVYKFLSDLVANVEHETIWNSQKLTLLDAVVRRSVAYMITGDPQNVIIPPCLSILWRLANGGFYSKVVDEREISSSAFHCLLSIFGGLFRGAPGEQSGSVLIGHESIKILRNKLIDNTISLICSTNDHCNTSNIEILKFIISKLPLRVSKSCGIPGQINNLEDLLDRHDMVKIVTDEMLRYAPAAEKALRARKLTGKVCDPNDDFLAGTTHSHFDSVKVRVGLLKMCIARSFHVITSSENRSNVVQDSLTQKRPREEQNGDEKGNNRERKRPRNLIDGNKKKDSTEKSYLPTSQQIKMIWSHFITNGLSEKTKDCVLDMFHFLLSAQQLANNSHQFDAWRIDLERTIFPLCRDICPTLVSVPTYRLLIYCVGNCNATEENYDITATPPQTMTSVGTSNLLLGLSLDDANKTEYHVRSIFNENCYVSRILNHSIEGLDLLWSIILDCKDVTVSNMAMKYIATLYTFDCNSETRASEQKSLIDGCFKILANRDPSPNNQRKILRILSFIRLFTESVYRSSCWGILEVQGIVSHGRSFLAANKVEVDDVVGNNPPFSIKVNGTKGENVVVDCIYGRRSKVGFVRRAISKSLDRPDIRLIYNNVELLDDTVMMGALGVRRDSRIFFVPRKSTVHLGKANLIETAYDASSQSTPTSNHIPLQGDVPTGFSAENQTTSSKFAPTYKYLRQEVLVEHGVAEFAARRRLGVLFSLLDASKCEDHKLAKNIRSLVWNLIQILPTESELDQKLQEAVASNCIIEWKSLLPVPTEPLHLYQLLYSLQAVERHLLSLDDANAVYSVGDAFNSEVAIIQKQDIANNAPIKEAAKTSAFVVIDDEDDDVILHSVQKIYQRSNSNYGNGNIKSYSRRMKENGGTSHLVNLLLGLEVGMTLRKEAVKDEEIDHLIQLLFCSNKIVHLVSFLLRCDGINSKLDTFVTKMLEEQQNLIPLVTQMLKILTWAVSFQMMENEAFQPSLTGDSSITEISAALVLQSLRLLRDMVFSSASTTRHFLTQYCTGHTNAKIPSIISDAIRSVVLKSPSRKIRNIGVTTFKEILLLKDEEDDKQLGMAKAISRQDQCVRSNVLGLLVTILREQTKKADDTSVVVPRFKFFFELLSKAMSVLWKEMDAASKGIVLSVLRKKVGPFVESASIFDVRRSREEDMSLGCFTSLFLWVLQKCSIMLISTAIPDYSLVGFLNLKRNMLALIDDVEINQLVARVKLSNDSSLLEALFDYSSYGISGHKIHDLSSLIRTESANVLRVLCEDSENNYSKVVSFFLHLFQRNSPRSDLTNTWGFDPSSTEKNSTNLVGLKNQGATCYMNSLLQQFFYIPAFRHGILQGLRMDDLTSEGCDENVSELRVMLSEFQKLFGNLLLSSNRFYDTAGLVASIKGYDGRPVRPGEQQDVDEFFNLFSDRLETALKGSAQNRILQNIFGGQLSHLITCKQCGFCSERVEDCLSISLDVKGKKNMLESFKSYIQGDLLDGANKYFCSKCDAKKDSVKRCCLKTLPNVLICHLKRFEFDLESLRKVKVNDRFEYPTELDLKDFTKEGIDGLDHDEVSWRDTNYYSYKLRGVLVHSGTSDSGHYYSLCSVRDGKLGEASNLSDSTDNEWYCFNDSTVTHFDPSTLDEASFGGQYAMASGVQTNGSYRSKVMDNTKSFSAYLLIYDRKDAFYFDEQVKGTPTRISPLTLETERSVAALSWKHDILERNQRYNADKILLGPQFRCLVHDICIEHVNKESSIDNLTAIQVITYHVFDSFVHSSFKNKEADQVFSDLNILYQESQAACQWFLSVASGTHQLWTEKMLLNCISPDLRSKFAKFLTIILQNTVSLERLYYYEEDIASSDCDGEDDTMFDCDDDVTVQKISNSGLELPSRLGRIRFWLSKSNLIKFIGSLIDFIDSSAGHWRRFDQLFQVLEEFAHCGQEESLILIRCGVILKLADFYQSESSVIPQASILRSPNAKVRLQEKRADTKAMGDRSRKPNFGPLISLLANLARSAHVPGEDDCDVSDSDSDYDLDNGAYPSSTVLEWSPFLIHSVEPKDGSLFYKLPARDARALCSKDLLEKILPAKAHLPANIRLKDDLKLDWDRNISDFACHLCFDNIDASKAVCSAVETIIKEKKSDQAGLSAKVLMALLHINDRRQESRIDSVASTIFNGIHANIEYEKELCLLLDTIIIEVASRSLGEEGFEGEVQFYNLMVDILEQLAILIEPNSSCQVKHRFFSLLKAMLPTQDRIPTTQMYLDSNAGLVQISYSGRGLLCHTQIEEEISKKKKETGKTVPYGFVETVKDKIFDLLTGLYLSVNECITSKGTSNVISKVFIVNQDITAAISACAAYSEYFMAMRQCLEGAQGLRRALQDPTWIKTFSEAMLPSFGSIDQDDRRSKRYHIDILKGEMILLFERLVQLDADQFHDAITCQNHERHKGDVPTVNLLEVFVTSSDNHVFNNMYTVHYYRLLMALGDHSSPFLHSILDHDNWIWSVAAFVLNQTSTNRGVLYDTLLNRTQMYIAKNSGFRRKVYKKVTQDSQLFKHNTIDVGGLELLSSIFEAENDSLGVDVYRGGSDAEFSCIKSFVSSKTGGMSRLSSGISIAFSKLSERNTSHINVNELSICLTCMHVIFISLKGTQLKQMFSAWPEIDDFNAILTQITTTRNEDPDYCTDSIKEIENIASKLQDTILAAQSTVSNKQ